MAMKKGHAVGQNDHNGKEICVGDQLTHRYNGLKFVVNHYGYICANGGQLQEVRWKGDDFFVSATWVELLKPGDTNVITEELDQFEQSNESEPADAPQLDPVDLILDDNAKNMMLADISDGELAEELRRRGYAGELKRVVINTLNI